MTNHKIKEAIHQRHLKQRADKSEKLAEKLQAGPRKILITDPISNRGTATAITNVSSNTQTNISLVDENQSLQNIIQNFTQQLDTLKESGLNDQSQYQLTLIESILNQKGPGCGLNPNYPTLLPTIPKTLQPQPTSYSQQTKVIDLLEKQLYETILGGNTNNAITPFGDSGFVLLDKVASIYGDSKSDDGLTYSGLTGAMQQSIRNLMAGQNILNLQSLPLDSNILRNLLYQARDLKSSLPATPQPLTPYGQTNKLATIVSSIEKQHAVIGFLQSKLQETILGEPSDSIFNKPLTLDNLLQTIAGIYGDQPINVPTVDPGFYGDPKIYTGLTGAIQKGIADFQQYDADGNILPLEQDALKQLITQSQALLREEQLAYQTEIKQQAPYPVFMGGMVQTIQGIMQQLSSLLNGILGGGSYNAPTPQPIEFPSPFRKYGDLPFTGGPVDVPKPTPQDLYSETIRSQIEDLISQGALDPEHPEFANLQSLFASYSSMRTSPSTNV